MLKHRWWIKWHRQIYGYYLLQTTVGSEPFLGLQLVHAFPESIDKRLLFLLELVFQFHFVLLQLQQHSPLSSNTIRLTHSISVL